MKEIYYFFLRIWETYLHPRNIKHCFKSAYQKQTRGFSDKEWWNLDYTIAEFIVPRLKKFKDSGNGWPPAFNSIKEWHLVIDEILWSFEHALIDYDNDEWADTEEQKAQQIENNVRFYKGMILFARYYRYLWD